MTYFNVTTHVGIIWHAGTSTVTTTGTFTVEGQTSTNALLLRSIYIPKGASTDIYISSSTGANSTTLIASGVIESLESFHYLIYASTLTLTIKNNSNNTAVYTFAGEVVKI